MSKRPGDEDRARRTSAKKSYIDDDPALIAALTAAEAAHTEEDTDREAAIAAGLMPYQLAEFERTCCAIPDALRRNPGRLCTLRNHFLSRASKMANRFMPLAEATKGLDPVWRTSTEESEQAAAVYECLSHHGLINWGVIDDHPAMVAPGRAPPFPQCVPCPKPAPIGTNIVKRRTHERARMQTRCRMAG